MYRLLFALAAISILSSCEKDPNEETNQMLEGKWNISSYIVNGDELYGVSKDITRASDEYVMTGSVKGEYIKEKVQFGTTYTEKGSYTISDDGKTITYKSDNQVTTTATLVFEGDNYTRTGKNAEDENEVVRARKE